MKNGSWVLDITISIALHIVILSLFAFSSTSKPQTHISPSNPLVENQDISPSFAQAAPPSHDNSHTTNQGHQPQNGEDTLTEASTPTIEYLVKSGDTLTALAKRVGCTLEDLAEINNTSVHTLSKLQIGQKLLLPK